MTLKADPIPFNRPYATGKEADYIAEAITNSHLSGDGLFTRRCHSWIEEQQAAQEGSSPPPVPQVSTSPPCFWTWSLAMK